MLSINGIVLDVQWEENETVAELLGKENLRSLIHFGQRRVVVSESGSCWEPLWPRENLLFAAPFCFIIVTAQEVLSDFS